MSVSVLDAALRRGVRPLGFALFVGLTLAACSPTFNWRELRLDGTPLQALMPCKPESATRALPRDGGAPADLHMHSCDAGGWTFAVAWADLGDAARVPAALAGWRRATLAALQVDPVRSDDPSYSWNAAVPGAQQAVGLVAQGRNHAAESVQVRAVHFARGTQVYQAAVYGTSPDEEITAPFFEGLKLP
jgi:hypothetical protein